MEEMDNKLALAHLEERVNSLERRAKEFEERLSVDEKIVNEMDKSLSLSMKQIESIAEDLKQTSINFKEAVMRSNNSNAKDMEVLKEKYKELNTKVDKVSEKLEKETTGKDAENWRSSKKAVWSWVLNVILALVAMALGISKFL